jgi:hypothetical protein
MALLDQLVQPSVISRTVAAPPASPAEGDAYIVAPSATGVWAGKDGRFAAWLGTGWSFTVPADGWLTYVADTAELAICQSGAWSAFVTNGGSGVAKFGVNTAADLTNRLAVAADASLFTHDGAGHQLTLNKASAAESASLLYQDDFSGRAELGLSGDDAFHLKVSPDGSSWLEALTVAQASGLVSLPVGQLAFPATQNPSANANTLDDYEEGTWTPALTFGGSAVGIAYAASTLGRYTKIGRLVTATANLMLSSKGSSTGMAQVVGLPFPSLNDSIVGSCAVGFASGFTSVNGAVLGMVQPNASKINFYASANGAASSLTNANFTNAAAVLLTVSYEAA